MATVKSAETTAKEPKTFRVKLPLTREKQDDVFVSVNGQSMKIQRGVEVEVSKEIYEVLQNSERMDELALEKSRKIARNF